ncbi:hypothetical protein DEAC_c09620 [Desulfosporosinus acididurans]|uniref:Uncharacterized protein n=1 Tax=Desulfosporosinus acididurans TaxID=476652 RepID=A0A0J1FVP1_9FIRM|nr:hypothetical protein [Desulfosporosinus acididurans]KLU67028.1 hypothetical protein DEAC_c09620 [Desulfosporosinus acididurans]
MASLKVGCFPYLASLRVESILQRDRICYGLGAFGESVHRTLTSPKPRCSVLADEFTGSIRPEGCSKRLLTSEKGGFAHKSELIAWRGGKVHEDCVGERSHGSHQVLPGGLVKLPRKRVGEPWNAE